ncbi:FUSC family protein [Paraburkholderia sp.]|uniref:FUSC family protein n=1 Tax=Paraburkholderia sp. TaxID=1926495 RepID=UPI0023A1DC8C|nr:FUSC family protein [Paraburkholderia sp.]MDE1182226.1 FUSC family protein [Paraburkholderia sp.]
MTKDMRVVWTTPVVPLPAKSRATHRLELNTMIAAAFSRVTGRLLVADPGLVRLHTALRAALACLLTGVVSIGWAVGSHQPLIVAAPGVLFAMVAPLFIRDARRADWFTSLFLLYVCAMANFAVATLLGRIPLAGDAGFLIVMFIGMVCQACGPRALGSAMLGVVMFYLGLYLHPSIPLLAESLALSLAAPAAIALIGRLVVPMRAAATMRLAIHTVTLRAQRLLQTPRHVSPLSTTTSASMRANLSSLNEAALALEERLALLAPNHADALRERLVELEVTAGQYAYASGASATDAGAAAVRHAIARLAAAARHDGASHGSGASAHPAPLRERLAGLRTKLTWLPATRATTAALLAMLLGHSLSPERWFWAVITTFVVFLGTRSRADTIYRGAQRVAGTLAGALVSVVLASTLHDAPVLLVIAMIVCVFGWAYFILSAYALGVFFITVLVGLVYGELGFAIGPLVELRIEEVLIGCGVSFAVAMLMMPLAATRHIDARLAAVLAALREVVTLSDAGRATGAATRTLDRSWHDLRIALRPLQTQRVFVWNPSLELATGSLLCCIHWARTLTHRSGTETDAIDEINAIDTQTRVSAAHVASIVGRLDALLSRYNGRGERNVAAATVTASPVSSALPADAVASADLIAQPSTQSWAQLDGAVAQLADRLAATADAARGRINWAARTRSA